MENDESMLKVTLEERIKTAVDRYYRSQAAGKSRKLLRRKNVKRNGAKVRDEYANI